MTFEDRLLVELREVVASRDDAATERRGSGRRRAGLIGIAAAAAVALAVLVPVIGGDAVPPAYAVTENNDGTVTVTIRSIRDDAGLERKIESFGIPASVHYLPQGKVCIPRDYEERVKGNGPKPVPELRKAPGAVRISETDDGAFRFTIDKSQLEPEWSVVVYAEDDGLGRGPTDVSIAAMILEHHDGCKLVPGSFEGWSFQQGARPPGDK
jgi:hypothetical protein